jgi:hypothetical protein
MLPELTSPIPDADHPSDHLPVKAKLRMRGVMERMESAARSWCGNETPFWASFVVWKMIICQDRLGANIGNGRDKIRRFRTRILAVLEGTVDGIPMTREQLRLGFTLFDWDGDGTVDTRSFLDAINKLNPESKGKYYEHALTSGYGNFVFALPFHATARILAKTGSRQT